MTPIRTSACNLTLVADDCFDLPATKGDGFFATYWAPDAEELAMIAAGMPIKLTIIGGGHPPVRLEVDTL